MKIKVILSVFFILLFMGCLSENTQNDRFESKEGRFSVLFPEAPLKELFVATVGFDQIEVISYSYEINGLIYSVSYIDYPSKVIEMLGEEHILDSVRDGQVDSFFGELIAEEIISFRGFPGRKLNISQGEHNAIQMKIYLVENRIYSLIVSGPKDKIYMKSVGEFLDSFDIK